jgi:hypothetical protein
MILFLLVAELAGHLGAPWPEVEGVPRRRA